MPPKKRRTRSSSGLSAVPTLPSGIALRKDDGPQFPAPAGYLLPWAGGEIHAVNQGEETSFTHNGLAAHPLSQLPERRDRELERGLEPSFGSRLRALVGEHAQLCFRVGYPWDTAGQSPRRPIDWVVDE